MRCAALAAACIAVSVVACADAPTASGPTGKPQFAATTLTDNFRVPINIVVFVPCADGGAGELVVLSGTLHVLFHITANKNGFHVKSHSQPQGISGVGQTTGDTYRGTGVTQDHLNVGPGETFTLINNFRVIGQGPGNNFLVHQTFHVTINANGEVTAVVDNFNVECK